MLSCQKHLFSLPQDLHYLNCAYMSPLPLRVEEAGIAGIRKKRIPADIFPGDFLSGLENVRTRFAGLVGAGGSQRIALIPSVSYGLASVARNLEIASSQNLIILTRQFPSNVYAWRRLAATTGAEIRTVAPPERVADRARHWNERLLEAIDRDTAVVAMAQVHWTDGTQFDLVKVGERCREVGAALVIDGTQSVGAQPFDVGGIEPDALICAGYKWLMGPYSLGVAYYGSRFENGLPLEETWLSRVGSDDFPRLIDYRDEYRAGAVRYEPGEISNFALVPMLDAALELIAGWGVDSIAAYCRELTDLLVAESAMAGFEVESARWRSGHIVGLRMPHGLDPKKLQTELADRKISVSVRGDVLRVSPSVYNDEADIMALANALHDVV
ncbi:MAG: aminotransferase class V-fold PLP-dependent enzyme [Gemmatimonadota bacterium]|nr:MAG: aminotransferase class V-fold PLP-dependent enzyme [Gemmatimonadota bacterium]